MTKKLLVLVALVSLPRLAFSQVPVAEVGPMTVAHTTTALQTTLTTIEAIFHTTQWILELTGYEETGIDGINEDAELLGGLMNESQALLWDINNLQRQIDRLYHIDGAPVNTTELQGRLRDIRRFRQERITQAQRLQTLQHTAVRIVGRLVGLMNRILAVAGSKQNLQNVQGHLAALQHQETQTATLIAAYQQVTLDDPQTEILVQESMEKINETLMVDWPGAK